MNLFGYEEKVYFDKYAGLNDHDRFRKMTTKANVDMMLNNFSPFNKAKSMKHTTKTVIAYDGTNISGTKGPIAYQASGQRNSNIFVNTQSMSEHLDKFNPEVQTEQFNKLLKQGYVTKHESGPMKSRYQNDNTMVYYEDLHDATKMDKAKDVVSTLMDLQVAARCIVEGVPIIDKSVANPDNGEIAGLLHSIYTGDAPSSWGGDMIDELRALKKDRGSFNAWLDKVTAKVRGEYKKIDAGHTTSDLSPLVAPYSTKAEHDDSSSSKACDVGHGTVTNDDRPGFVENETANDNEYGESNDTLLDMEGLREEDKNNFFRDKEGKNWKTRDDKMERLSEALYESLAGRIGKVRSQNPSKRLNTRALVSDLSDNIYISKQPMGGKHLSLNLILDTSGSMSGHYLEDSVDIINCINKLALRGVITGKLMLSASGASSMISLPIEPSLLPKISAHNGGEGFRHTFAIRWKELKEADYNIALTDGHLTDGHIDKKDMHREGISVTGIYVDASMKEHKERATKYTNRLTAWFSKSAVRSSPEEAIYYLIDQATLNYDMNPRSVA